MAEKENKKYLSLRYEQGKSLNSYEKRITKIDRSKYR